MRRHTLTDPRIVEEEKRKKYVAYRRNVLADYNIESIEVTVECETPVEVAMVYYQKHGSFPTDIHEEGVKDTLIEANTALRTELNNVRVQRDNFAASLNKAIVDREIAIEHINKLHDLVQTALAASSLPIGEEYA